MRDLPSASVTGAAPWTIRLAAVTIASVAGGAFGPSLVIPFGSLVPPPPPAHRRRPWPTLMLAAMWAAPALLVSAAAGSASVAIRPSGTRLALARTLLAVRALFSAWLSNPLLAKQAHSI